MNTFGYVGGDPLTQVDPNGLSPLLLPQILREAGRKVLQKIKSYIKFDGPRPGRKGDGTGSLMQIRFKNKPIFRIDLKPIDPANQTPVPHFHIIPDMKKHREFPDFLKEPIKKGIEQCLKK